MLSRSQVKYIQSLAHKKRRDEHHAFIAEGPKLVAELLHAHADRLMEIFATESWLATQPVFPSHISIQPAGEQELERITQLSTPNQVLAVVKKIDWKGRTNLKGQLSLGLDTIQDPGNLGTIIRTADWFGIRQVFCSPGCADIYNPKTVQSTMGSIARVRVEYTELRPLVMENSGVPVLAAVLNGTPLKEHGKQEEGLLLIGNESRGLEKDLSDLAKFRLTIPGSGGAESLNAAVATGILLSFLT